MAKGLSVNVVNDFFHNKSILTSYNFEVYLDFRKYAQNNPGKKLIYPNMIKPYHILSVDVPSNEFSRETVNVGTIQYSYPILNKEQPLDIKITFEEDNVGTIHYMARELEGTVIQEGLHICPYKSRLGDIIIDISAQDGRIVNRIIGKDVFFLGAEGLSLGYDSSESIKYDITFGTDYISYQNLFATTYNELEKEKNKRRFIFDDINLSKESFK